MKVAQEVLTVLSSSAVQGNRLVLPGTLDRKLYMATNKVLEAAGAKWTRSASAHVFDGDAADRVDQIILSGEVVSARDDFDFFPTPPELAAKMARLADIPPGARVLEPSAGNGALIRAILAESDQPFIVAIEANKQMAAALRQTFSGIEVFAQDFMSTDMPAPVFDAVVMNPPFSKRRDIQHVTHAMKFLRPGGRLVAIVSAGALFRQDRLAVEFRELVANNITPLPEGSFKASGTGVNTAMVLFTKR